MSQFKVGDRVRLIKGYGLVEAGLTGVVVDTSGNVGVNFNGFDMGHNLNGLISGSSGYYIPEEFLELIKSTLTPEEQGNVAESQAAMQVGLRTEARDKYLEKESNEPSQYDTIRAAADKVRKNGAVFHVPAGSLHTPGAKDDSDKPEMSLVLYGFADALLEVGKVATMGAKKYTRDGWKTVPDGIKRYADAGMRHMLAEAKEPFDKESGLYHAAHYAWNALARLQLILEQNK